MSTAPDTPSTVLVIGATGKVGRRLVPRLRLGGHTVRAASRSGTTRFDWSHPGTWDQALSGANQMYVVPPSVPGPVHQLVRRAAHHGVRHVVLQSGHRADRWDESIFGRDMRSAEDAVRGSDSGWTVLRAANFAQNFDEELWHAPLLAGELALPAEQVPEPFIDVEDVAEVATVVLSEPGRHAGRLYELTGPRALTFAEAVEVVSRASGLAMTFASISPAHYTAALVEQGVDEDAAREVTAMFEMMASGALSETSDDVATVLGRGARPFEDYAARAAAAGAWQR